MVKVLHLRSSFDPGGTETLLLNLFNFKQELIELYYALLKDGVYINKLNSNTNRYEKIFRQKKADIKVLKKLKDIIKRNNIRIIHTHQPVELIYAAMLKIISPDLQIFHHIHLYNPKRSWDYYFERLMKRFCKKTFVVSWSLKEKLEKKGYSSRKMYVLYNAVECHDSVSSALLANIKKKIKYRSDDIIIGMIGNFVAEKDQKTIIKAYIDHLKISVSNLKILFIGQESIYSEECKLMLNENDLDNRVFFLGQIPDAWQILTLLKVFVLSSHSETFSIALVEALLNKVPVLASDIDVFKELSDSGRYFKLFRKGDPADLALKINSIISVSQEITSKRIEQAYQYALKTFSYSVYIKKLYEHYTS